MGRDGWPGWADDVVDPGGRSCSAGLSTLKLDRYPTEVQAEDPTLIAESVAANVTDPEMRGRVYERALIVEYLIGAGEDALAKQIEYGHHVPLPIPPAVRTDGRDGV